MSWRALRDRAGNGLIERLFIPDPNVKSFMCQVVRSAVQLLCCPAWASAYHSAFLIKERKIGADEARALGELKGDDLDKVRVLCLTELLSFPPSNNVFCPIRNGSAAESFFDMPEAFAEDKAWTIFLDISLQLSLKRFLRSELFVPPALAI
uniref:Uncharacterized protein n=1 Tax=Spongospora subterranea TaxID=70186 RepID=A0A0H5QMY1_9EUKA|eukprot:CRZ02917.1 hypothetical protein [Spongospora subterranea]